MLLASKAGGYMDNAFLAVDGGRNMVRQPTLFIPRQSPHRLDEGEQLMIRWQGSMMVYHCLMRRTSRISLNHETPHRTGKIENESNKRKDMTIHHTAEVQS